MGLFWPEKERPRPGSHIMPPVPPTGWKAPREFPNLSAATCIGIDTETYDPDLLKKGPGWARGRGHVVGVSVAVDGHAWYFPIRHEVEPGENMKPDHVFAWLRHTLSNPSQPKIGANLLYDLGWLRCEAGIKPAGELVDVQFAEALLDERANVSLETLAQKYLIDGKLTPTLYNWLADFYGGKPDAEQRANIYRAPPSLVGPYAEQDADLPLRLARELYPLLLRDDLIDLFRLECALIPLLIEMRIAGVRVDINAAERLSESLSTRASIESARLCSIVGFDVEINSAASLARAFDSLGIPYGVTPTGKPSFKKDFLETIDHPAAATIREIRKLEKLRTTFVEGYVLNAHVGGRVFGQFHPLRGGDGGTRSGRFASSKPNLQNLPSRDDELAPLVRGLFVPDEGHAAWRKYDYSQIEYRFLIHFATGPGADAVRARFNANPETDYHELALDLVAPIAGWDISTKELRKSRRKPIKNVNFGLVFGMGVAALSANLGLSEAEGAALFAAYHAGVPFAKATMDAASEEAQTLGTVSTILGRKSRFDLWETRGREQGEALPYAQARTRYGARLRRAFTHKALNRKLQGSAADLMKAAMLQCWRDGVFSETGVPRLTVHDELDFSDPGGKDEAFREMRRIMETAITLKIPVRADGDIGPNWGNLSPLPE